MRVALFGATGFIGSRVLEELIAAGHEVTVLARSPDRLGVRPHLTVKSGDVGDPTAVVSTVTGADAVISCLGTPRGEKPPVDFLANAMARILKAMEEQGVERLIAISGAGITLPGERKPFPHNAISRLVGILAADAVRAKANEFKVLQESQGVGWTAVRPTRVVEGPSGDSPRIATEASGIGMQVTRGDLARFIVGQLTDRTYIGRAPFISS